MGALDRNVSFFAHFSDTDHPTDGTFLQIVTSEKLAARHAPLIERIRQTSDKKERDALKKTLPCFTPSGTFRHRSADGLLSHSGLLQFDIDPKENPALNAATAPDWKAQISHLKQVAYCALSASGTGVWGVVPIAQPDRHKEHFAALKADFAGWGIALDEACSNVDRLRFWSCDPDAYFNPTANAYTRLQTDRPDTYAPRQRTPTTTDNATKVEAVAAQIEATRTDITDGYDTWFSIGCALASEFGEGGRDWFHRVSQHHPDYRTGDTDKQFSYCLRMRPNRYTLGTFFEVARRHGMEYRGHLPRPPQEAPHLAPQPPTAHFPAPSALPPGYRRERYTDRTSGQPFDVLLNADGYPAAWDLPAQQRESLARIIQQSPAVAELICRFDMRLEGVEPVTEESEREWEQAKARAQQIVQRAKGAAQYEQQKQQSAHRTRRR